VAKVGRPGMSDAMKDDLWQRWRAGESISVISRGIRKPPGSVFSVLKHHGGIAPAVRRSQARHLQPTERESISRGINAGESLSTIAASLERPVSTISREVARNGGRIAYRASAAQDRALEQARRPKPCLLARVPALQRKVVELLELEWSPEQIAGHLRLHHGGDSSLTISHETIYRSIYITRWKVIPRELCKKLRTGRPIRKNKRHTVKGQWRSQIIDARPIEDRPADATNRTHLGHLEGDLIIGSNCSQVATLVDRKSRHLTIVKLASRHTAVVIPALVQAYARIDPRLRCTLTWDRGMELAGHTHLTTAARIDVFFAAPRSPWQRGTNENTNKLLRQYLPKGTDLGLHSQQQLDTIADRLNNRPRKCLGFHTPQNALR
jgi:IS30 family transposase